jgi:Lon protease-like protein
MGLARIPLFPLPVVLLPGMRMPLHIFEPRYQQMLRDCLGSDRTFGLIYQPDDHESATLRAGSVGCVATIADVETQANGRANIAVTGGDRFRVHSVDGDSHAYLVGNVEMFDDVAEPIAQLTALALRLSELFTEAALEARAISDDGSPIPSLGADPAHVAFAVAAVIELDAAARQRLLESTSASERMRDLIAMLDTSLPSLRDRATVHRIAKRNGHSPHASA